MAKFFHAPTHRIGGNIGETRFARGEPAYRTIAARQTKQAVIDNMAIREAVATVVAAEFEEVARQAAGEQDQPPAED